MLKVNTNIFNTVISPRTDNLENIFLFKKPYQIK